MQALKNALKSAINFGPRKLLKKEFDEQTFVKFNERPIEFGFVFRTLGKHYPKKILDVGTGTTALPHLMRNCGFLVTAADNIFDYWPKGMFNRHYHIVHDDITKTKITDRFDLITCISTLEHIVDFNSAVDNMFKLLNPGGKLVITCPFNEQTYYKNVYDLPNSSYGKDMPYIAQAYSNAEVTQWCQRNNATILDQEYWKFWDGEYWTVGNRVTPPVQVDKDSSHQISCILFEKGA
jgi:SAM-dependent methyltransferase